MGPYGFAWAGGFAPTRIASVRGKRCLREVNQHGQLNAAAWGAGQKQFHLPGEGRREGPQKAAFSEMSLLPLHGARVLAADSASFSALTGMVKRRQQVSACTVHTNPPLKSVNCQFDAGNT